MSFKLADHSGAIALPRIAPFLLFPMLAWHSPAVAQLATDLQCSPEGCVDTADIAPLAVTPEKLAEAAIGTSKFTNFSVIEAKIATNAVTAAKIKDGEIGSAEFKNFSVIEAKIATNAVTAAKIKDGEIGSAEFKNFSVIEAKIATNAVTSPKILNGTILLEDLNQEVIDAINAGGGGGGGLIHTVDCVGATGDFSSIQAAVNAAGFAATIKLLSDCAEDVIIEDADELLITADQSNTQTQGGDHTLTGSIFVDFGDIEIEYLTVTGSTGPGIWFEGATIGSLTGVISTGNARSGFLLNLASAAGVEDSSFTNNGGVSTYGAGIEVANNSAITVSNSTMNNNVNDGIGVFRDSFARVTGSTLNNNGSFDPFDAGFQIAHHSSVRSDNNTVSGNGYAAVEVGAQSFFRSDNGDTFTTVNTCTTFCAPVFDVYRQGYVEMRGTSTATADVTNDLLASVFQQSLLEMRNGATATGNVDFGQLAYIRMRNNMTSYTGSLNGCNNVSREGPLFSVCRDNVNFP